ncbi:ATP-binding protein [Ramlibacter sp. AN1015]|uniref:ATP-binding protein n=1 Tax=Ramlibacter sp. AN1015 TaxID=3133428 RepID=UPI0030BDCCFF
MAHENDQHADDRRAPHGDALTGQLDAIGSPARLLEEIFRSAPVGLQLYDGSGRCVLVNPMHTRLFGAVPTSSYNVLEDTVLERAGLLGEVRRAFAGDRVTIPPVWYDVRELTNVRIAHGRRIAVAAELVPLRSHGGEVTNVLFVFSDVTEAQEARERAEAAARRAEFLSEASRMLSTSLDLNQTLSRLARLATPTLADFCIVDLLEPDGSVRRVAAAHASPLGQPIMDDMLRHPPVPGSPQPARRVLDSGRPELLAQVDAVMAASRSVGAEHAELLRRLGVRSHLAVPMLSGSVTVGVISLGYVLERRYGADDIPLAEALASRAAAAIENARLYDQVVRSEERFRMMADSVPQVVWITDAQGNSEFFNRQWTLYTGEEAPATAAEVAQRFVHPEDVERTVTRFEAALVSGEHFLVEHRIRSAQGEYRWFLVRGVPQRGARTGDPVRWFGVSMDIHDLKMAEGALREADRRKDEFLAMLAHELRNPLAAISNAWWLMRSKAKGPELARSLEILGRQTRQLTGLVDDLLDVSRVTRGLVTLRRERLDLRQVVDRATETVQPLLDEKGLQLRVERSDQELPVHGDAARLEQIAVNLLGNAAKYTDAGGQITVVLRRCEGHAELLVEDSGIGIAPEFLAQIFELFAQAERGLARSRGGLGVGLTVVKRLAELHGGCVEATSPGLDQGARFRVLLPTVV